MPTRINREKLLQTLQSVAPGLAAREIIEQSTCAVFRKGRVSTYNDEVCVRGPSGLDSALTGAVKLQPVLDLLAKLTEDEVEVGRTDSHLTVTGKGQGAEFVMEKEIALPVSSVEKPGEWSKLPGEFCDAVALVGQAASKDRNSEYDTDCLHIHPKWIECTDRIQACRWDLRTGFKESVYVKQASVKHVAPLGMDRASVGQSWVHFKNSAGLVLSCRLYLDVKYPDLSPAFKVEGVPLVLPRSLPEACEKAQVFSKTNELDRVLVELAPGKMTLTGYGPQGRYWRRPKLKYKGQKLAFLIAPEILSEITQKHNECVVGERRLCVKSGSFTFVCSLGDVPDEMKNGHTVEATSEGDE